MFQTGQTQIAKLNLALRTNIDLLRQLYPWPRTSSKKPLAGSRLGILQDTFLEELRRTSTYRRGYRMHDFISFDIAMLRAALVCLSSILIVEHIPSLISWIFLYGKVRALPNPVLPVLFSTPEGKISPIIKNTVFNSSRIFVAENATFSQLFFFLR